MSSEKRAMEVVAVNTKNQTASARTTTQKSFGLTTGPGNLVRDDTVLYTGGSPYASLGLTSLNIGT